ncbi:MAG: RlmE family RNA methyltransferase [Proteobacteria bacterium]|jgi:23S rRNA (uridine2552-2'-O)-methyltransferase|nr:RlmE family RNA methyltransferase [Alphaproteobacteria bacterium]NCC02529.1 RlmE family RNA methyltransferase [Pseudomonadota bacterium]
MKEPKGTKGQAQGPQKRREAVRVKTAKKRSNSSTKWLKRQLNDPYVAAAKEQGYRSRAAFKIIELDEQFHIIKPGMRAVDLGAAPGGWSQIVARKIGKNGKLVSLDILPMEPIEGADILHMDFLSDDAPDVLKAKLGGQANLVLSDMAPSTIGHTATDHLRIMALAENAAHFAMEVLAPDGAFVCKLFQGGAEKELLTTLKQNFTKVRHAKPPSSRSDSAEMFLVALGFRGKLTT